MPFRFTSSGYTMPNAGSMRFQFGAVATANLQAAINVLSEDYLKECPTYTIAYGGKIQIIQLPCVYGGYRHLGGYIYGNPEHADLGAYIYAVAGRADLGAYIKSTIQAYKNLGAHIKPLSSDQKDLGGYLKPTIQVYKNLGVYIKPFSSDQKDLGAYIKSTIQAYKNLGAYIKPLSSDQKDLGGYLKPTIQDYKDLGAELTAELLKATFDLGGVIDTHPPADLRGIIRCWTREAPKDLPASINGELFAGIKNLGAEIGTHLPVDLGAYISSKFTPFDLPAYLYVIGKKDLPAFIKSTIQSTLDLGASIISKPPNDLPAYINGILFKGQLDLGATLVGGYGPYDLQAYLRVYPHKDLPATIGGWYSGTKDLRAVLSGWQTIDLGAYIGAISAANLTAYINVVGKAYDLGASIIPKTIRMKRALLVSLLEHKDLAATINFQCFGSRSVDLGAYLYTIYKKDLPASIWGFGVADNVYDLKAYINAGAYYVQDTYTIRFISEIRKYTKLKLRFRINYLQRDLSAYILGTVSPYTTKDLSAYVTGVLTNYDLPASITPIIQSNYTDLPYWIWPKTHEIVIDFDHRWRERWRRTVELLFRHDGADPYHYFYVGGNQRVYKLDRTRHWTIWAHSYVETDDMIERRNIRRKYIFKMSNYNTIDEAIRDIIDRVSTYRQTDLSASITSILPNYADLNASVGVIPGKKTWVKSLHATVTVIP